MLVRMWSKGNCSWPKATSIWLPGIGFGWMGRLVRKQWDQSTVLVMAWILMADFELKVKEATPSPNSRVCSGKQVWLLRRGLAPLLSGSPVQCRKLQIWKNNRLHLSLKAPHWVANTEVWISRTEGRAQILPFNLLKIAWTGTKDLLMLHRSVWELWYLEAPLVLGQRLYSLLSISGKHMKLVCVYLHKHSLLVFIMNKHSL